MTLIVILKNISIDYKICFPNHGKIDVKFQNILKRQTFKNKLRVLIFKKNIFIYFSMLCLSELKGQSQCLRKQLD